MIPERVKTTVFSGGAARPTSSPFSLSWLPFSELVSSTISPRWIRGPTTVAFSIRRNTVSAWALQAPRKKTVKIAALIPFIGQTLSGELLHVGQKHHHIVRS